MDEFSMRPADPGRVIAAALEWEGTPYHDQASRKGVGCDCLGLARGIWREVAGREPTNLPRYTRDWGEAGKREIFAETARGIMIEIDPRDAEPGALIVFRMRAHAPAKHCGVLLGGGKFIHAYERAGVLIMQYDRAWQRRAAYAFLFPEAC
ncbi:MAG: NlpC/P60 family protein [Methyloligellaceae bacterium]